MKGETDIVKSIHHEALRSFKSMMDAFFFILPKKPEKKKENTICSN